MSPLHSRPRGQSNVEYALVLVLVAIVVILVLVAVSGGLGRSYQKIADALGASSAAATEEFTPAPLPTEDATEPVTPAQPGNDTSPTQEVATPNSGGTVGEATPVPGNHGGEATPVPGNHGGEATSVPVNPSHENIKSYYDKFDGNGNIQWTNNSGRWSVTN